jgi:phosphopentomutase
MNVKRIIVIVLDGVGIGEAPDAALYGDVGSNSIANTAKAVGGLHLPQMGDLGLGCITKIQGVPCEENSSGAFGKMQPRSAGKDTISGHWELMGICLPKPLPTYPNGFPPDIINEFKSRTGKDIIGNKPMSGTEIIKELGVEHIRTGKPILYTSADSVFQLAAHEEVIPVEELYKLCEVARNMLIGDHAVGRVIARPFLGHKPSDFWRTNRRRDYAITPDTLTMMDKLLKEGKSVYSVGKIDDIFGGRGITKSKHTTDNKSSVLALIDFLSDDFEGLLFVNLIEFDMIYGHRKDASGYAKALEAFDSRLPEIQRAMSDTDVAIITGDHGVDPTTLNTTDHSREYVPLLVFGAKVSSNVNLGVRQTFSDVAATIAEAFSLEPPELGKSFLQDACRDEKV